jgi:Protein of unknown function with HXXEE motif
VFPCSPFRKVVPYDETAMDENVRSTLLGTAGLSGAAVMALLLTILRPPLAQKPADWERTARLFLLGLAAQCLHVLEEFGTCFPSQFPALWGLPAWSENFFVGFYLLWLSIWILSVLGLARGARVALFPVWFFGLASLANGAAHPVLAILVHGYFPGLLSSPVVGVLGGLVCRRLFALTRPSI